MFKFSNVRDADHYRERRGRYWEYRELAREVKPAEPLVTAKDGDCSGWATTVWVFSGSATRRGIYEYFRREGVNLRGYSLTPSAYDCTGRWWCDAVDVGLVGYNIVVVQRWYQDV